MDWQSARHPSDVSVTENGVATFDNNLYHDWREISLVCSIDITDMILPSDAEYLTLTFHVKALKGPGIFSTHSPCLCCAQNCGENKYLVCPDLDGQ